MANNELSLAGLGVQMPYNMQAEQSVLGAARSPRSAARLARKTAWNI